jgi:hypothetical protein
MVMGQPVEAQQQATFVWLERDVYASEGPGSGSNDPYSWTATPTEVVESAKQAVQVNCAVEFGFGAIAEEPMGAFDASRATLTLLDEDWALVEGADQVLLSGITYLIEPPGAVAFGLFDVTVYQLRVAARA